MYAKLHTCSKKIYSNQLIDYLKSLLSLAPTFHYDPQNPYCGATTYSAYLKLKKDCPPRDSYFSFARLSIILLASFFPSFNEIFLVGIAFETAFIRRSSYSFCESTTYFLLSIVNVFIKINSFHKILTARLYSNLNQLKWPHLDKPLRAFNQAQNRTISM